MSTTPTEAGPTSAGRSALDVPHFLLEIRHLVGSAEPAVAFTSLARICVPLLADECHVIIQEGQSEPYQIAYPTTHPRGVHHHLRGWWERHRWLPEQQVTRHWISTPIVAPAEADDLNFRGCVLLRWHGAFRPGPVEAAAAQTLSALAVGLVSHERLVEVLRAAELRATVLRVAREANRVISDAVGLLVSAQHISRRDAFGQLRSAGQYSGRETGDIAAEVVRTGRLDRELLPFALRSSCRTTVRPPDWPRYGFEPTAE